MDLGEEQWRTLCKSKMKLSLINEIVRKIKDKTKKGKNWWKNYLKKKLMAFFFCHVSAESSLKFRHISILFNILILGVPTMQSICHVGIFR